MPRLLVLLGGIASGKTAAALRAVERARGAGLEVWGVAAPRVCQGALTVGYRGVLLGVGETLPLVYRRGHQPPGEWAPLRGPYLYNPQGFQRANQHLFEASRRQGPHTLTVVDEYGHLEEEGLGLAPGLRKALGNPAPGSRLLVTCRAERLQGLLSSLPPGWRVSTVEVGDLQELARAMDSFI